MFVGVLVVVNDMEATALLHPNMTMTIKGVRHRSPGGLQNRRGSGSIPGAPALGAR